MPPVVASKITGVKSLITGEEIEGLFFLVLLLPDQILGLESKFVLDKITQAGQMAENAGAQIVGLGGLTSIIGNQGEVVSKNLKIAVTTGNTYTAASTIKATLKAAKIMEIDLSTARAAVIGATGSIGSACSYILAEKVASLNLVARNQKRLNDFAAFLKLNGRAKIETSVNIQESISDADIVITATSATKAIIDPAALKPGALICDVAIPRNVKEEKMKRKDIVVIDGGMISPPGKMEISFDMGLPKGIAYACLCETMILAFEKRFENYSLGRGLSLSKVKEILHLGSQHGFKLSGFKSFGQAISEKEIRQISEKVLRLK